MSLGGFAIFHKGAAGPPKKVELRGRIIAFSEIGDSDGPGHPGDLAHTHSLKWPHTGKGPAFSAKATVLSALYSENRH